MSDLNDALRRAARETVAGWPPLSEADRAELFQVMRQIAERRIRTSPAYVAAEVREREVRAEMRVLHAKHVDGEVPLSSVIGRLRQLEREVTALRNTQRSLRDTRS